MTATVKDPVCSMDIDPETAAGKSEYKGQRSAFIMEMLLYHVPDSRTIGLLIWQRSVSFLKKAGTSILAMSLVIWLLSTLPNGNLDQSYLVQFGKWIEPVGRWMGFDWRLTVALITSFPAKENAVATLGVLFIPCMTTVAVIRQETNSWGWTLLNLAMLLVSSVAAGAGIYHLALALGV